MVVTVEVCEVLYQELSKAKRNKNLTTIWNSNRSFVPSVVRNTR